MDICTMTARRPGRRRNTGIRRGRNGFTMIEVLAAAVIVGTCIASIVSMWSFGFGLTAQSDQQSVGYCLGRRALEEVKQSGFQDTSEGTATYYFDSQGGSRSTTQTASHAYSVTIVVSTDTMNGATPAPGALRTVTVTTRMLSTGASVYSASTYLARAGV